MGGGVGCLALAIMAGGGKGGDVVREVWEAGSFLGRMG